MKQQLGAIPCQIIRDMIAAGYIKNASSSAIQPGSLDLTITDEMYRMRGSYLPRPGELIEDLIHRGSLFRHYPDRPLEQNGIYLIKLQESLELPPGIHAIVSNKSSSGRINLRGRLIAEGIARFDDVPAGYRGNLWIEVIPKSFPVLVHPGDHLNQMRFFHGDARLSSLEHRMIFDRYGLLRTSTGERVPATNENIGRGVTMTVDLTSNDVIGWRAKQSASAVLDTARFDHAPEDFFEPVMRPRCDELILHPEDFYLLATKEGVITPPEFAAEMAAYDSSKGEFRSHFAGFFDPGWGWREKDGERGTIGVLEVEAYSHDFVLRDSQPICLMVYERMLMVPEQMYGAEIKSHYATQRGPRLAKWFTTSLANDVV
jgi:dCTP deaminase